MNVTNESICHEQVICSSQFVTNESYVAQVCREQSHPSYECGASTYNKFILSGAFVHYLDVTYDSFVTNWELHMTHSWQIERTSRSLLGCDCSRQNWATYYSFVTNWELHMTHSWQIERTSRSLLGCDCSRQTWATYDSFVTNWELHMTRSWQIESYIWLVRDKLRERHIHYLDVTVRDTLELHMTRSWQIADELSFELHLLAFMCHEWATYMTTCHSFVTGEALTYD